MPHLGPEPEVSNASSPTSGADVPGGGELLVNPRPAHPVSVESSVGDGVAPAPATVDPHLAVAIDDRVVVPEPHDNSGPSDPPVAPIGDDAVLLEDDRI